MERYQAARRRPDVQLISRWINTARAERLAAEATVHTMSDAPAPITSAAASNDPP